MKNRKLNESLFYGDLKNFVNETFNIDRYSSKMGEDEDIIVINFDVKEKLPALDLMEFIEKNYNFILDADISSGEEQNGHYQVFVEIERTPEFPKNLNQLMRGVGNLCDNFNWKFKYQKDATSIDLNEDSLLRYVPVTKEKYIERILKTKNEDIQSFFNQGSIDTILEADNILTFKRQYAGDIQAKFIAIGDYESVKKILPGPIDLSENGQSQTLFLNKYIGNYDINKIGNNFLIRNKDKAIIIEKLNW